MHTMNCTEEKKIIVWRVFRWLLQPSGPYVKAQRKLALFGYKAKGG
jgi:hypothetical protein